MQIVIVYNSKSCNSSRHILRRVVLMIGRKIEIRTVYKKRSYQAQQKYQNQYITASVPKTEDFEAMSSKIGNCGQRVACFKLRSRGQCLPARYYCKELEPMNKPQCELPFTVLIKLASFCFTQAYLQ